MPIKNIPTLYHGTEFRSRLEARWAVFFDMLGLTWLYEYEGFALSSGYYVPDFWLPEKSLWVEIKPKAPSLEECLSCEQLADVSGHKVILQFGTIEVPEAGESQSAICYFPSGGEDYPYLWCECPWCGKIGIE